MVLHIYDLDIVKKVPLSFGSILIKILKPILNLFVYVLASNGTKKTCKSIGFKARA